MGSQFLGLMPRAAAAPKSSTQPQQQTMWTRARHGLWSTTGLEMTLLADDGSLFFSPGGGYGGKETVSICLAGRRHGLEKGTPAKKKDMGPSMTCAYHS